MCSGRPTCSRMPRAVPHAARRAAVLAGALHAHLGIRRAVVVQANCHGADHAALLDALARSEAAIAAWRCWGGCDPASVRALHDAGVRGARFNFVPHLGGAPDPAVFDHVAPLGLIAPLGWHLCLHLDGAQLPGLLPRLRALPPFVIDHMGRVRAADGLAPASRVVGPGPGGPAGRLKVSGLDRIGAGRRPFAEGIPFVRALVAMPERPSAPGTDWPHPNVRRHAGRRRAVRCLLPGLSGRRGAPPGAGPQPGAAVDFLTPAPRARPGRVATTLFDSKGDKHVEETILRRPCWPPPAGSRRGARAADHRRAAGGPGGPRAGRAGRTRSR